MLTLQEVYEVCSTGSCMFTNLHFLSSKPENNDVVCFGLPSSFFSNIEWLCELKTFKARGQQIEREFQLNINLRLK